MSVSRILEGKRALISGAGTGIGREVALEFARQGAAVVLHYCHDSAGARGAVEEIRAGGGLAEAFAADFTDLESVRACARQACEFLGGIDVLVNNAGITMNQPFAQVTPEQFDTLFGVNIRAMFFLTQAALPALQRQGTGAVVNLTSIHAFGGRADYSVYAATKGAIVALTRQLAIELAPARVRVNAIAPGVIEVENYYRALADYNAEESGKGIPAGFAGQPRDVAQPAVFLASDSARFITGQTLVVDGGTTSWFAFSDEFQKPSRGAWGRNYVPGR